MVAVEVVLLLGVLAVAVPVLLRRRSGRRLAGVPSVDGPARLLGWATGLLSDERAGWGQAMLGELEQVRGPVPRWHFALGCLGAMLLLPARRAGAGRLVNALVVAAAVGCAGLVGYGLLRYPGIL